MRHWIMLEGLLPGMVFSRYLSRALHALPILLVMLAVCGCPQMAEWRDSQIQTSKELAEGNTLVIPNPPLAIPRELYSTLPLLDSFTVLAYSQNRRSGETEIDVLLDKSLDESTQWAIVKLNSLGYKSDDNASRILEGTTYTPVNKAAYREIYIKLEFADSGRSIMRLKARTSN